MQTPRTLTPAEAEREADATVAFAFEYTRLTALEAVARGLMTEAEAAEALVALAPLLPEMRAKALQRLFRFVGAGNENLPSQ